jgi:hypothetical protein
MARSCSTREAIALVKSHKTDVYRCDDGSDVKDTGSSHIYDFGDEERQRSLDEHAASFRKDRISKFFD